MISTGQNECLRKVGDQAASQESWKDYAVYCRSRESGLRHQAFQRLNNFLDTAISWSFHDRVSFVNWLCSRLYEFGESDGYGLIPQPLAERLIGPTLFEWADREATDPRPCRWLGMFFSGVVYPAVRAGLIHSANDAFTYLREALRREPNDQLARIRLIEMTVGNAEYSCHELPHGYIGEPAEDLLGVEEAKQLLTGIVNPEQVTRLQSELDHVSHLINDWISFKNDGAVDFHEWCAKRGRKYRWIQAYSYVE